MDASHRHLSYVTLGLTIILSFAVLHIISHVIGVSVDTVFVCYLEGLLFIRGFLYIVFIIFIIFIILIFLIFYYYYFLKLVPLFPLHAYKAL